MRPGSRGHEYQDALQYARWGVDYLKYDWCNTGGLDARSAYATMSDALRASGRPIVFSLCNWGLYQPWRWGAPAGGNLWRHEDLPVATRSLTLHVPPTAVRMLRETPVRPSG